MGILRHYSLYLWFLLLIQFVTFRHNILFLAEKKILDCKPNHLLLTILDVENCKVNYVPACEEKWL